MGKELIKWIVACLIIAAALSAAYALEIKSGTSEDITLFLKNSTSGEPITGANCALDVWNPSNSKILVNGTMTEMGDGFYYYTTNSSWTTAGNYKVMAKCAVGTKNYHSAMSFKVVGTTVTEWFGMLNATTNNTLNYLQNTVYPAVDQAESKLDNVLTNTSNIWNKVVDIQSNVTTTYNAVSQVNTNLIAINFSVMNELENNRVRLLDMNSTLWKIYNNITLTLNPKLDQLQTGIDLIKGYTDTLEAGQASILANISQIQTKLDTITTTSNQVLGYVDTLEDTLDCNGSTDTPICNKLDVINSTVNTINANTDSLEAGQTTITNYVDTLESGQATLTTGITELKNLLNCSSMPTDSVCSRLNLIQGYTDTLESGQTTITNYVDTLEAGQSSIFGNLESFSLF